MKNKSIALMTVLMMSISVTSVVAENEAPYEKPVLVTAIEKFDLKEYESKIITKEDLRADLFNKIASQPSNIELSYYGDEIKTYDDIVKFVYSAIDSGSYGTGNIKRISVSYKIEEDKMSIYLRLSYRTSKEEEDFIDSKADEVIDDIIAPNMNDYEKVKAVHDYIVNNTSYSSNTTNDRYSAYALFKENAGVCNAYALSMSKFLDKLNIENMYIKGHARSSGGPLGLHAWNKVKVDNEWYNIDSTWARPVNRVGHARAYQYFMVSDETFYRSHVPRNNVDLPDSMNKKYEKQ